MGRISLLAWLPKLNYQIWILAFGRLLSQIGTGFTLFYAPIFFVNEVGLSATAVGLGLGVSSIAGVLGRFLGGIFADSPRWGRRQTLLVSAGISALADGVFILAGDFAIFTVANILMGLGIGLYWPATEAFVADMTTAEQRNEAYALTRLGDNVGLSLGVVLGGALIATTANYRALFAIDGISFVAFFVLVSVAIAETLKTSGSPISLREGWGTALSDRRLQVYVLVNILFTTYLVQVQSTMPVYFSNFVSTKEASQGFSPSTISALFTWHIVLAAVFQLPLARLLNRVGHVWTLTLSLLLWAGGFILIGITGIAPTLNPVWATVALGVLAIAMITYLPSASAFVVTLAPESLRGIYLSINSQCWAIGYFIGPPLGGWSLDQSPAIAHSFWLVLAASTGVGILILRSLNRILRVSDS